MDLPEEFAFVSGKFVSLIGFKLVPTGLFFPSFDPYIQKIVDRLSVDFERPNFMPRLRSRAASGFFEGKLDFELLSQAQWYKRL